MGSPQYNAVIAGAGFFGVSLAKYLGERFPSWSILIVESQNSPMMRASKNNQARLHNGYHYPRALHTANASKKSYERFKKEWPAAVFDSFTHIYGVSRSSSYVTADQFFATMSIFGAQIRRLEQSTADRLFDPENIEAAFEVEESAFDFRVLRDWALEVIGQGQIDVLYSSTATAVRESASGHLLVDIGSEQVSSRYFFNATYGGIEYIEGLAEELKGYFTHQATEMKLVEPPPELREFGITVMDGPFFSVMPYPAESCHSLSHVRYTPRGWSEGAPLAQEFYSLESWPSDGEIFNSMLRDATRYVPVMAHARLLGTIREIKTLVLKSRNDGRPIFFFEHQIPGCFSILGGKLDNVFDMFEFLDRRNFA